MDRTLVDTGMLPAALVERREERIRTLEDALRPFAEVRHHESEYSPGRCVECAVSVPWPCKYETARRALEGQ